MIFRAPFESDLEFSSQVLVVPVPNQKAEEPFRVRRDVERFRAGSSRPIAGRDVAHGIAAGFAAGDSGFSQETEQIGRLVQVDVIQLNIFSRGEVKESAAETVRGIRQGD